MKFTNNHGVAISWHGQPWRMNAVFIVREDEPLFGLRLPHYVMTPNYPSGVFEADDPGNARMLEAGPYGPAEPMEVILHARGNSIGHGGIFEPDYYQMVMRVPGGEAYVPADFWAFFRDCVWESAGPLKPFRVSRDNRVIAYIMPSNKRATEVTL